ncbi:MAG: transcriptional repressor [Ignavibacteria bacterium]|jgi:Fe2+ or Zn2+ uptake regulation protein|nr:transcriptional repressor [Ignavibacteria bacterium]
MKTITKLNSQETLLKYGISPSIHRMTIMNYMLQHRTHPTADEIYSHLHGDIPTLSKTTIYNTLKLLVAKGAIQEITIDEKNTRYDAEIEPHSHFKCNVCGHIYDVPSPKIGGITDKSIYKISEVQVYYRGICTICRSLLMH